MFFVEAVGSALMGIQREARCARALQSIVHLESSYVPTKRSLASLQIVYDRRVERIGCVSSRSIGLTL